MQLPGLKLHVTSAYGNGARVTDATTYASDLIREEIMERLETPEAAKNGFTLPAPVPGELTPDALARALNQTIKSKDGRAFVVLTKAHPQEARILLVQVKAFKETDNAEAEANAMLAPPPKVSVDWRTAAARRPVPDMQERLWTNPNWGQKPTALTVASRIIEQLVEPLLLRPTRFPTAQVILPKGVDVVELDQALEAQTKTAAYLANAAPHHHGLTRISFRFREPAAEVDQYIKPQAS